MDKDTIISFEEQFSSLDERIEYSSEKVDKTEAILSETSALIDDVYSELSTIPGALVFREESKATIDEDIKTLNILLDDLSNPQLRGDIHVSALDIVVSIVSGLIATIIDIVFVGTPEIVKIYKGGENFDGSILTKALRQIGNNNDTVSGMLRWLSEKCKVPYDVSAKAGIVTPNNHRLRSLGHDPLFGLLFAVADIILGTATLIDNSGNIRILVSDKDYPLGEKLLSVFYYFGHLLSDVCTARGLPIPGFILTQFFSNGDSESSVARAAEQMYADGYDLRHLASMETPVFVKNMITDVYIKLAFNDVESVFDSIAEKEIREHKYLAYKYRLRLMSDAVGCGGNVLKFFLPPTMGNMTALNLPEWASLIKDTISEMRYQLRDKNIEKTLFNREIISKNWKSLSEI